MRPVKVQYRYRKITEEVPRHLHIPGLTKAGMDRNHEGSQLRERVASRIFDHPRAGKTLLNRCDENEKWVFGELAVFTPGAHIPVIQDAGDSRIVDFAQIETPSGHHPLKGVLYWLAVENHLLAIQTPNMSVKTLTDYLNWLIHRPGLSEGDLLFEADISVENEKSPPINDIVFRTNGPVGDISRATKDAAVWEPERRRPSYRTEEIEKAAIESESRVMEMLQAAAFGDANIERLKDIAGPDGEILLELHIKIKRERKFANFTKADAIALVSDLDEDEVKLRGPNGRHVGTLMKLTYDLGRVKTNESLFDPDDAKRVLQEAYGSFRANGYIDGPAVE